jgi:ABC-type branched-subunit amino acid transport system substrate-binding protein
MNKLTRVGGLLISVALVGAACGSSKKTVAPAASSTTKAAAVTTAAAPATTAAAPATTAGGATTTAGAAVDAAKKGALAGMKGSTPLVKLSDDFKKKLNDNWVAAGNKALTDYNYGPETYDAVVILALAVEKAGSDGVEYAKEINGITKGGTKCTDYKACLAIIKAKGDPDYDGISGPLEFAGNGEPTVASYGILQFGADNKLDDAKTVYKTAKAPAAAASVAETPVVGTRKGDGTFKIGTILPQTGSLAFLGPPEFAAVDLVVKDINAAGGVLGKPMVAVIKDSGDAKTDIVNQSTDALLAENVDAIIGAASSGVSLKVIDKITGAGVVQFSPANTSKKLSTYDDKGLYFRDAPSDILQGAILGEVISGDGNKNVAIINRNDAYGVGLTEDLTAALKAAGLNVVVTKTYEETADKFNTEVNEIKAAKPDAIAIIGFEESSKILSTLVEAGIGPTKVKTYGCDGNIGNALATDFEAGK